MRNKAQATLEFSIMFFIMVVLFLSLLKLWKDYADKIIKRQQVYNSGRSSGDFAIGTGPNIPYTGSYGSYPADGPGS